jgi:hypothetical protein
VLCIGNSGIDMATDKCCSSCKWSIPIQKGSEHDVITGRKRVECTWQYHNTLPISLYTLNTFMYENEGEFCACWEKR